MSEYLLSDEGLRSLCTLLLWAVALALFIGWFFNYCRRTDELWKLDNPIDTDRCPNTVDVIREIESLRRPLPSYRNMHHAARAGTPEAMENLDAVLAMYGCSEQDRADTIKGSKIQ